MSVFPTLASQIGALAASLVCGLALWRGDGPLRLAGGVVLVAWLLCPLGFERSNLIDPSWGLFYMDLAVMAILVTLSLKARRLWSVFAAAAQINTMLCHVALVFDLRVGIVSYRLALAFWSYMLLAALAGGVAAIEWRRLKSLAPTVAQL